MGRWSEMEVDMTPELEMGMSDETKKWSITEKLE